MHQTLVSVRKQLGKVVAQVQAAIPNEEPFGNAHGNWSFPGLTRAELMASAQSIADLIDQQGGEDVADEHDPLLQDYVRRLQFLQQHTIGQLWGNAGQAVPAYLFTLQGLRNALAPVLVPKLSDEDHAAAVVKLKKLAGQLRSMEARLNGLEPRTASLTTMVERIEQAHNAADQLPTDLESLAEARQKLADLARDATQDQGRVLDIRKKADDLDKELKQSADDAKAVLERCETAYSAATSVGLAAAFNERSDTLSKSMWVWVAGLVLALGAGSFFGSAQLTCPPPAVPR